MVFIAEKKMKQIVEKPKEALINGKILQRKIFSKLLSFQKNYKIEKSNYLYHCGFLIYRNISQTSQRKRKHPVKLKIPSDIIILVLIIYCLFFLG